MKIGIRKPSIKKSIKARTTGRAKRTLKKAVLPGYGKKGIGWLKNPKKAAYNKVYNKTTVSIVPSTTDMTDIVTANSSKHTRGKKSMKPALKYGLIVFAIAVLLFMIIPDSSANDNANITDPSSSVVASLNTSAGEEASQIDSGGSTDNEATESEASMGDTDAVSSTSDTLNEPVVELEPSVDWSSIKINQKTNTLEYSKKSVDPLTLLSCDDVDVDIDTNDEISLKDIGNQTVFYTLTKDGQTKDIELTFEVKDTKKPKITFVKKEPKITAGEDYNPLDNIKSVKDPVDGALEYTSDDKPGKGEYSVTGYYDTDKKGTYEIKVTAKDKHGNKKIRTFNLVVKAPQNVAANAGAAVQAGEDYILNTNTHKFHHPWCRAVGQMSESNKWAVHKTREEVISMGYDSCGICRP